MNRTRIVPAVAAALTMLAVAACGSGAGEPVASGGPTGKVDAGSIVVGSANFPENVLLAEIYAGALAAKGVKVEKRLNIGNRETYIPALQKGTIDLVPEYTGVLNDYFNKNAKATDPDGVQAELKAAVPTTLQVLDMSAAEDKDALVVTKATAARLSLKSIGDLESHARDLTVGGPPEWKTRMTGVPGLKKLYGIDFKAFTTLDAGGPLSVQALKNGQVDAVDLFTTDPSIATFDFVILDDPKSLYAAQNVVPLITKSKVSPTISATLNAVSAKLDTTILRELVRQVVVNDAGIRGRRNSKDAAFIAREFLKKFGLS